MPHSFWRTKRCKCTLCDEPPFSSVVEGKAHVNVKHRIPFTKARKYLKTKL